MRIESFNCGKQVSTNYSDVEELIDGLKQLKLPTAKGYAEYPAHNPIFNAMMDMVGKRLGWQSFPLVIPKEDDFGIQMKGDLGKTMEDGCRVFVEIEIGNSARVFADIVKFDVASQLETHDFFIFILPGKNAADKLGYCTSFQKFLQKRDFFKQFIRVPLIVVEIEPREEFDLNSVIDNPSDVSGRWGSKMSTEFIIENKLEKELGIV
mgnify:CR=1 FL=1